MTIYQLATVVRSKNAGPFTLTIDLLFAEGAALERTLRSPGLRPEAIAAMYGVEASDVAVHVLRQALAIKVTLPRRIPSGSIADRDVYGSQQHFPLAAAEVP